jgi:hypothetical protein
MSEKRLFERAEYEGTARVRMGAKEWEVQVGDLSVGGAYVLTTETVDFGAPVTLILDLPALSSMGKGNALLTGTIRWIRQDGFGIQFGPTGALVTYALAEYVARKHAIIPPGK